jgi:DNA-binding winged helix-turn-helix (wHTH) protein
MLLQENRELRLIPRYLDLLIFLVEHRHQAVHRRDIFERVWADVIVSDSALAQAIRTLRRTLGDDSREPLFIRTISRHGYQFVYPDVIEEPDGSLLSAPGGPDAAAEVVETEDGIEPLLQRLTTTPASATDYENQREAAERLHVLGTRDALARLAARPGHAYARAMLRDTRWDVPDAGDVPLLGHGAALEMAAALVKLRVRRVARLAAGRSIAAGLGGGAAGIAAGVVGGTILSLAPGSSAPAAIAMVLGVIGLVCGSWGGLAVGFGVSLGEAVARSHRRLAVVGAAALAGGVAGTVAQWMTRVALATLIGLHVPIDGAAAGLAIGGAVGLGLVATTPYAEGGFAAPRGRRRVITTTLIATLGGVAALVLALFGIPLVGGTIHAIAQASTGSEAALTPLSRLLGEPGFGPLTRALIGTGEGGVFGLGVALGLTHHPVVRT